MSHNEGEGGECVLGAASAEGAVPADVAGQGVVDVGQQSAVGEQPQQNTLTADKSGNSSEDDRGRSRHRRWRRRRARRREHAHSSRRSDSEEPRTRSREKKRKRLRSRSRSDEGRGGEGGSASGSKHGSADPGSSAKGGKEAGDGGDQQDRQGDRQDHQQQQQQQGSQTGNRSRQLRDEDSGTIRDMLHVYGMSQDIHRQHTDKSHHSGTEGRSYSKRLADGMPGGEKSAKPDRERSHDRDGMAERKSSNGRHRDTSSLKDREQDAVCKYRHRRSSGSPAAHHDGLRRLGSLSPPWDQAMPSTHRRSRSPAISRRSRSPPARINRSPVRRGSQSPGFRRVKRAASGPSPSPELHQENCRQMEPPADRDSRVPSEPAAPRSKSNGVHVSNGSPKGSQAAHHKLGVSSPRGGSSNGAAAVSKAAAAAAVAPAPAVKATKPVVKLSFEDDMDIIEELTAAKRALGGTPAYVNGKKAGSKHHEAVVTPVSKANPAIVRAIMADTAPSAVLINHTRLNNSTAGFGLNASDMRAAFNKLAEGAYAGTVGPAYGLVAARKSGNILIAGDDGSSSSSGLNVSSDELSTGGDVKVPAGKLGRIMFGVAQARCGRPYMEDRHCCVSCWRPLSVTGRPIEDGVERSYAGLFDGHNGERCAEAAAARLHMMLACDPVFRTHTGELAPPATMAAEETAIAHALRRAFQALDEDILKEATQDGGRDGATALVLLRLADTLYVAHLGDSRAVLCRAHGVAQPLTQDHKPDLPAERARVEAAGGRIELQRCWRVIVEATRTRPGSGLAVSRSLGDSDFKRPLKLVDSTPDVSRVVPKPGDSFVIMATDGLWDVMSDQEAVDVVYNTLQRYKGVPSTAHATAAAEAALQLAVRRGTLDNVTVIVIVLAWGSTM